MVTYIVNGHLDEDARVSSIRPNVKAALAAALEYAADGITNITITIGDEELTLKEFRDLCS
jgi:hypothetical protein